MPTEARTEDEDAHRFELIVVPPKTETDEKAEDDEESSRVRHMRNRKIADRLVSRIERRLKAAEIGHFSVARRGTTTISVRATSDHDREWLRMLVTAPGALSVRRVVPSGALWGELEESLPEHIELRAPEGADDADRRFLWSAKRAPLVEYLRRVALADRIVETFPVEGGWRSLALDDDEVASHSELKTARASRSQVGTPFATLTFENAIGQSGANERTSPHAIVLDGEVVGIVEATGEPSAQISLTYPRHRADLETQRAWARQIAGRLAAPLPVKVVDRRAAARRETAPEKKRGVAETDSSKDARRDDAEKPSRKSLEQ